MFNPCGPPKIYSNFLLVLFYFRDGMLCLHVCIHTMGVPGSLGGWQKASGPLNLGLLVTGAAMWMPGTGPGLSGRAGTAGC